jgi:hypothetical protein
MKILSFESYDEYRRIQSAASSVKHGQVYAEDPELKRIAAHFRSLGFESGRGLCHGVRNGYEVRKLRALLPGVDIIGTDISETAATITHCISWDMHEIKPEWVRAIDFIYSNSWDHTYDPNLLFTRWSESLSPRGRLYLSYTDLHSERGVTETTKIDAFGCSLDELIRLLQRTFVLDDLLEIQPMVTLQTWRRRLVFLQAGRLGRALTARLTSRRVQVLVLRRTA